MNNCRFKSIVQLASISNCLEMTQHVMVFVEMNYSKLTKLDIKNINKTYLHLF